MRGKAKSRKFLNLKNMALLCLLLIIGASGCKKKTDQVSGKQETKVIKKAPFEEKEGASGKQRQETAEEYANQLVFDMHLVSVFDLQLEDEISWDFLRGQDIFCDNPSGPARPGQYPPFKSAKPIYGTIRFAGQAIGPSPPRMFYHLAIDESAGTGTGYDRLYFDRNGDGDLADEKPLMLLKDPPKAVLRQYSSTKPQVCFESFEMTFDFGSAGKHAVEMIVRLIAYQRSPQLTFFRPKVHRGEIAIGKAKYDALLGYGDSIGKPFDQPDAIFHLIPKNDPKNPPRWSGANRLNSMHKINGKLYQFTSTPAGDKLFARPYDGAVGTFEVGPGGRDIQEVSIQGSLRSEDTAVAVGDGMERGWPKPTRSCRLPEGDYLPANVTLTLGKLQVGISDNLHTDGKRRGRAARNHVYGIKIREDKPYIFDLANKPDVLFVSPVKDKRIRLGGNLEVNAVLIDPELDIMIRRLNNTSQKQKKEYTTPDGQKHSYEVSLSLDPTVIITRANGEKVAEGVMPFG